MSLSDPSWHPDKKAHAARCNREQVWHAFSGEPPLFPNAREVLGIQKYGYEVILSGKPYDPVPGDWA
eukprot:8411425-Karenia_brevis.AAC.1